MKFLHAATERVSRTEILLTHFRIWAENVVTDHTPCLSCATVVSDLTEFPLLETEDSTPPIVKSISE